MVNVGNMLADQLPFTCCVDESVKRKFESRRPSQWSRRTRTRTVHILSNPSGWPVRGSASFKDARPASLLFRGHLTIGCDPNHRVEGIFENRCRLGQRRTLGVGSSRDRGRRLGLRRNHSRAHDGERAYKLRDYERRVPDVRSWYRILDLCFATSTVTGA
jgi:hypothetical protein